MRYVVCIEYGDIFMLASEMRYGVYNTPHFEPKRRVRPQHGQALVVKIKLGRGAFIRNQIDAKTGISLLEQRLNQGSGDLYVFVGRDDASDIRFYVCILNRQVAPKHAGKRYRERRIDQLRRQPKRYDA